jgi:hypothetical protein
VAHGQVLLHGGRQPTAPWDMAAADPVPGLDVGQRQQRRECAQHALRCGTKASALVGPAGGTRQHGTALASRRHRSRRGR